MVTGETDLHHRTEGVTLIAHTGVDPGEVEEEGVAEEGHTIVTITSKVRDSSSINYIATRMIEHIVFMMFLLCCVIACHICASSISKEF